MVKLLVLLFLALSTGVGGVEAAAGNKLIVSPTVTEASPSATIAPTAVPLPTNNLTEPRGESGYRLESVLENRPIERWNGVNTVSLMVRKAVERGVAANTIVLLLLLPMIATLVSIMHYILGLSGYGIFTPSMIAIVFLATGVLGGLGLFALILGISLLCNLVLRRFRLHFWPARSISLMFISLGTFGLMAVSSYLRVIDITKISIFPVLFMIMLAEDFVRTQLAKSKKEAKSLTIGTLVLAMVGAVLMQVREVQEWVLLYPEVLIVIVLAINLVVGSYKGIRLTEIRRFGRAIRSKEGEFKVKKEAEHV
jgi:hypothetical protein